MQIDINFEFHIYWRRPALGIAYLRKIWFSSVLKRLVRGGNSLILYQNVSRRRTWYSENITSTDANPVFIRGRFFCAFGGTESRHSRKTARICEPTKRLQKKLCDNLIKFGRLHNILKLNWAEYHITKIKHYSTSNRNWTSKQWMRENADKIENSLIEHYRRRKLWK